MALATARHRHRMRTVVFILLALVAGYLVYTRLLFPPVIAEGCGYGDIRIPAAGQVAFRELPVVRSTNGVFTQTLDARYRDTMIDRCRTHLRSYNGLLTADTWRVKPGDRLRIHLVNDLGMAPPVAGALKGHAMHGNANGTNLHTHGLHVSPEGNSDNPMVNVQPGKSFDYDIQIPANHPPGTHWYHPHLHGGTAVQQSSGMSGALIVEGGLDDVPEIKAAREHVLVLQQITYDQTGKLEDFDAAFGPGGWRGSKRLTLVNGQIAPTIYMRPGEVQRWRIVQAGTRENVLLKLQGHALNEIAADGIAMGRMVAWNEPLLLGPGYRSDVLVQTAASDAGRTFDLVDEGAPAISTLQGQQAGDTVFLALGRMFGMKTVLSYFKPKPRQVLAHVVVVGTPLAMALPEPNSLASLAPYKPIRDAELTDTPQHVTFDVGFARCTPDGVCTPGCILGINGCKVAYTISGREFNPGHQRVLMVGRAAEWTIDAKIAIHPFHIHVNPFETTRLEPDGKRHVIWKDTIQVRGNASPLKLRMRYEDFAGTAVLHCHILDHEDQGMMDIIMLEKPPAARPPARLRSST